MADETNDQDFFDRVGKSYERWTGESYSPEQTVENFQLFAPAKRIEALEQIDQAIAKADTSSLRKYSKLTRLRTDLENVHANLVKIKR